MLRRTFLKLLGVLGVWVPLPVAAKQAVPRRMVDVGLPFVMLHVNGCKKPAAYMVENPPMGALVLSSQFRKFPGGERFAVCSVPICGSWCFPFGPTRSGIHTNEMVPRPVRAPTS